MSPFPPIELPEPAFYFPPQNGKYDVSPGLTRLAAADFGNGARDRDVFQFDNEFERYRANRVQVRASGAAFRYSGRAGFSPDIASAVTRLIVARLTAEHPRLFFSDVSAEGSAALDCALTGDTLRFDSDGRLESAADGDVLGALCGQFAEDIVVLHRAADGGDRIVALDVCAPSHWAPEEKLGLGFDATHVPVPGMERSRAAAAGLVNAMICRPPTVRFTWGIASSDTLNRHPAELAALSEHREFADASNRAAGAEPPLYLRVERQTIYGLPDVDAALFAIRVYIYDLAHVLAEHLERRDALIAALHSMSPASRLYKGLTPAAFDRVVEALMAWPA